MAALTDRLGKLFLWPYRWTWLRHLLELGIYLGAYLVYLLARDLVFSGPEQALANARHVIGAEQALGIFWEPGWQAWTMTHAPLLVVTLNWFYILSYWPVVLGMAVILYWFRRKIYYYYRNIIAINLAIALVVFVFFPLAPPHQSPASMVDTIQAYGPTFYGGPVMEPFYNTRAAMPSLHFSWSLIFGVIFLRTWRGWFRVVGVLYPIVTFFAITLTGNHYILDSVAGFSLAALVLVLVDMGSRRHRRRQRDRTPTVVDS